MNSSEDLIRLRIHVKILKKVNNVYVHILFLHKVLFPIKSFIIISILMASIKL